MKLQKNSLGNLDHMLCLFLFCLMLCMSCSDSKTVANKTDILFNKEKWMIQEAYTYPYRPLMLNHIMDSDTLRSMTLDQVQDMLGEPSRIDSQYLFYTIDQKRIQFFPLHTTTLVLRLNSADRVEAILVHK